MKFTVRDIAQIIHARIEGNPDLEISGFSKIDDGKPNTLSFLANPLYTQYIYSTLASAVIVSNDFVPKKELNLTLLRVENPYVAFATLLEKYQQMKASKTGISPLAFIASSACLGQDVYIGEFAFIGENVVLGDRVKIYPGVYIGDDTTIGDDTVIYAGVRIYYLTQIGKHCTIHSGVVISADGFGFAPQGDDYRKVAQIGNVIIEDHVEIGANTTIDRATLGSTIIRKGVKLDNLIQVAHNVEIGENTVIAAQTGISGSTRIGRNCMIGGQVGIIGHITIADEVKVAAQSGIGASITEKGAIVQGSPAFEYKQYQRAYVHFRKLHELYRRINELEARLKKMESDKNISDTK